MTASPQPWRRRAVSGDHHRGGPIWAAGLPSSTDTSPSSALHLRFEINFRRIKENPNISFYTMAEVTRVAARQQFRRHRKVYPAMSMIAVWRVMPVRKRVPSGGQRFQLRSGQDQAALSAL
jgi:hypothetical protein